MRKEAALQYFNPILTDIINSSYSFSIIDPEGVWIAGGALREFYTVGKITKDIDLYFKNGDLFEIAKKHLLKNGGEITFETKNGTKIKYKNIYYDLIKIFYSSPQECIDNFDFTVCSCACSIKDIYYHENFIEDLASKKLMFNNIIRPSSSMIRVVKYIKKGYDIPYKNLQYLVNAIKKEDEEKEVMDILTELKKNRTEQLEKSEIASTSYPEWDRGI